MGRIIKLLKDNHGFTLLELMVSLVIMSFGMMGVIGMFVYAIGGNAEGRNLSKATNLASQKIEELKLIPYANLTSHRTTGAYAPTPNGIFTISDWTKKDTVLDMRNVTVTVTWTTKAVNHNMTLTSVIAKP